MMARNTSLGLPADRLSCGAIVVCIDYAVGDFILMRLPVEVQLPSALAAIEARADLVAFLAAVSGDAASRL